MEHGYYWLHLEDEPHEVVEIDGDTMYRCGSDVTCRFEDGRWVEFGVPLDVLSIIGPMAPPPGQVFVTEYLRLDDDGVSLVRNPLSEWPEWADDLRRKLMPPNVQAQRPEAASPPKGRAGAPG